MDKFLIISLEDYYNADAISYDTNRSDGAFGLTSYPAELLPESNEIVHVNHVPFKFPSKEDTDLNNIECNKQEIRIAKDFYESMHFMAACDNGSFEETIELVYVDEIVKAKLCISDWIEYAPLFGEVTAFTCNHLHASDRDLTDLVSRIWVQSIKIDSGKQLHGIKLPDNPCLHLFAITLQRKG